MSNRRAYYYPLLAYLLLLLMVWVGTFFADVLQLLSGEMLTSSSLVSAEGVRWALRSTLPSLNALPWGTIVMLIATYGLLSGSGFTKVLWRLMCLRCLTASEWRAFLFSSVAVLCYILLLYLSAISPWSILSGITEEPALSPIVQGWALLLFIGALSVSLIYGFIYGNYRSMIDVMASTGNAFTLFVPAIMALIPASGIVSCLQYAGVQMFMGLSWNIAASILYLLPFLFVAVLEIGYKKRSHE